jgi:sulfur transfer protein SufE
MILLPDKRAEIINGLLPLLAETYEEQEEQKECEGRTLIYNGVTEDKEGNPIQPGINYVYAEKVQVKVDHEKRLNEVIDRARTMDGMMEDLSRYLVKYGTSKEAIKKSRRRDERNRQ